MHFLYAVFEVEIASVIAETAANWKTAKICFPHEPIDNGHYRWDLNFAPGPKQAIIGCIEGRKGKATVEIKEYGENDRHSHRTYNRSIQFSSNGRIAYFCLIAA